MRGRYVAAAVVGLAILFTACSEDNEGAGTPTGTARPSVSATAGTPRTPAASPSPGASAVASPSPLTNGISIDAPPAGEEVEIPFAVSGQANVFEAALQLQVLDAGGNVLCTRPVQATSGSGTPGTWQSTVAIPPPASPERWTLRAFSYSARDGSEENVVTREVTVGSTAPRIVIESPACGASVSKAAGLTVSGRALAFEAVLQLELRNASGVAVVSERAMAASGTEMSPYTATLDISGADIPPGFYTLVAFDYSARDGTVENEFPIPIEVRD